MSRSDVDYLTARTEQTEPNKFYNSICQNWNMVSYVHTNFVAQ